VFIDEDPVGVAAGLAATDHETPLAEVIRFSGPLRAIVPWEWSWFDEE
jgi:hypothetical protein